ncbi:prephenate dehydrogenase [Corynebacterium massiliense]|uniref:Prephenate dehydrogenase n=1 Tax=Corynebacterium massiliense DSM 45435 TaxID=1121364 RepID=A0ABY7U5E4_9CORY|nr:prephenate dehydrogenase [Corynebacterium massiliense]WCZ31601.1 prephenate dehydrogenase [Corynebacterium massiliense DSM 45435]
MSSQDVQRPICIVGLGLIGGSLLRDLATREHPVYGYNHSTSGARTAIKEGYDVSDDLTGVLQRAEQDTALLVIAVPMHAVSDVLDAICEHAPSCGITDVVSVKSAVYDEICARGLQSRYVGGHPMAGTTKAGWKNSQKDLFIRSAWAITYDYAAQKEEAGEKVDQQWIDTFTDVVRMTGMVRAEAVPVRVDNHDAAVARVSHLPQILAEVLAVVGDHGGILAQSLTAGPFKDGTRVAGTTPKVVKQMCESNAAALVGALDETLDLLQEARDSLDSAEPTIGDLAETGHRARTRIDARSGARKDSVSPIKISSRPVLRLHPGGHGWVAQLKQTESIGGRIEIF